MDGERVAIDAQPEMPLLYALRDDLKLNNTVHLDGEPVRSCVLPVSAAAGKAVTTIAGRGTPQKLHRACACGARPSRPSA